MRSEAEIFKMQFSWERVCAFFVPSMWGYVISHKDEFKGQPCITLNYVDSLYNVKDGAKWLIKTNLTTLYSMSMSREPFTEQNADIAADIFLAKNGSQCTLYMMSVYFGCYISDYKSQYSSSFDLQDILKQFREKFLPQWGMVLDNSNAEEKPESAQKGAVAVNDWLVEALREGRDIRQGGLYRAGFITDAMIREAQQKINNQ